MSKGETGENDSEINVSRFAEQQSANRPLRLYEPPLWDFDAWAVPHQQDGQGNTATLNERHERRNSDRQHIMPEALTMHPERSIVENASDFFDFLQPSLWMEGTDPFGRDLRNSTKELCERLQRYGAATLSTAELFFVVLGTVLSESSNEHTQAPIGNYNLRELLRSDFGELCQRYDLDVEKAAQLQALLEIARRLTIPDANERYIIRSTQDAANLVIPDMAFLDHEQLRVLVLDTKNGVVANQVLYQGTVNSSVLRISEVFRMAITRKCPGIIVCHNHPSGSLIPSPEDIQVTTQLLEAAKLLEIDLIDHLIIGGHNFLSLRERLKW